MLTVFLAGTDTTSVALSWMFYVLSTDAALQAECAAEALRLDLDAASEAHIMSALPALRSLFFECVRFHGAAPYLFFELGRLQPGEAVTLAGRRLTHADGDFTIVALTGFAGKTERAGELGVGSRPHEFDARRWRTVDGQVRTPADDVIFMFGSGARVCPGRDVAQLEALVSAVALLQAFSFRLPEGHPKVGSSTKFTQQPDQDIRLIITAEPVGLTAEPVGFTYPART